ncbi:monofunctional biosynthetic peptidoglycan transglycosylase [soil metagenome]
MARIRTVLLEAVLGAAGLVLFVQAVLFMKIGLMTSFDPSITSFMRDQQVSLARDDAPVPLAKGRRVDAKRGAPSGPVAINRQWVDYDHISRNIKRAVIASEDANFAEHSGIDIDALERAYERNQRRGKVVAGGSTITQQLAKNLFLSGSRNYARKAEEFVVTFMLEFWLSKQRIYEIYLNVVEWGVGTFGIEAASRHYYGVGADRLGPEQAARLAAMLPNPRFFDRNPGSRGLAWKTNLILTRMGAAQLPDASR